MVVEVENRTPVPFAVALVIRPFVADGVGAVSEVTVEPVAGGRGRDVAHLVRVDGRPAVVLPRRPARLAAGDDESGDALHAVTDGSAGADLVSATCADGLATLALVLPVPHTATLRVVLPVGEVGRGPSAYPSVLPDAPTVAAGWEVHRRGPRLVVPEQRVEAAVARARAQLQLAHDGASVRRDGHRSVDLEPGATEVILAALDLLDHPADVGAVVARWSERLADPPPEIDALFLCVVARHWLLHRDDALLDWMLPEVAAAVERLDRADRRRRLGGTATRRRAAAGLSAAATMLTAAGQPEAGTQVRTLADRLGADLEDPQATTAAEHLQVAATRLAAGGPEAPERLGRRGPHGGRGVGHGDLAGTGSRCPADRARPRRRCRPGARGAQRPRGRAGRRAGAAAGASRRAGTAGPWSSTTRPPRSVGSPTPCAGTAPGPRCSGISSPTPVSAPVRLTVPGLDPAWSTTELRGDALLAEVTPPAVAEPLLLVAEHPDIDPVMRRPGSAPDDPGPTLPEGGSFS